MENENNKATSLDIKLNDIYNKLKNIKPNGVPNELRIRFFYLWLACYSGRALSNSNQLIMWTCLLFVDNFTWRFFFFYFIKDPKYIRNWSIPPCFSLVKVFTHRDIPFPTIFGRHLVMFSHHCVSTEGTSPNFISNLRKFNGINYFLFPLKSSENLWFSNNFRENESVFS